MCNWSACKFLFIFVQFQINFSTIGRYSCHSSIPSRTSILRWPVFSHNKSIFKLNDGYVKPSCQASIKHACIRTSLMERVAEVRTINCSVRRYPESGISQKYYGNKLRLCLSFGTCDASKFPIKYIK